MEVLTINPVEFGIIGLVLVLVFNLIYKVVQEAFDIVKKKYSKEPDPERRSPDPLLVEIQADVSKIKTSSAKTSSEARSTYRIVERLEKAIDGNGQPGLVPTVARLDQRISDHVGDPGLHTSEK